MEPKAMRISVSKIMQNVRRIAFVSGLAVAMWLTGTASAQFGEAAGIAEAMQPEYYRRDVDLFARGLNMDDSQKLILESLYEDYVQEFDSGKAAMEQRFEDMKDDLQDAASDKNQVLAMVFTPIRDWADDRRVLGERFLENIRLILNEEQLEQWPAFEQELYREKHLHKGRFSGESVNLFYVLRDMRVPEAVTEAISTEVTAYSNALHNALKHRERETLQSRQTMLESMQTRDTDMSMRAIKRQVAARLQVRDVNDTYIEVIARALPEEYAARFNQEALAKAYPRVYRPVPHQNVFESALRIESLEQETIDDIRQAYTEFLQALAIENQKILTTLRQYEPEEYLDRAAEFSAKMNESVHRQISDPVRPMIQRRKDLGREYLETLKEVIGEERFAAIPGAERWLREPRSVTNYRPRALTEKEIQANPNLATQERPDGGKSNSVKDAEDK